MHASDFSAGSRNAHQKSTPFKSDGGECTKESGPACHAFVILTAGAVGMACLISLLPAAGHDQMWLLYSARLVLRGAKLYGPELFESNPPLIVWLSAVPAMWAGWLHLPATTVGKLLVLALEAGVGGICLRMLRSILGRLLGTVPHTAVWAVAFAYVAVFAVMPARDFGQRDHILALLCLPYLLASTRDAVGMPLGRGAAFAVGLAAGLGIALKPHQALVPVAVELMVAALRRRRRARMTFRPELAGILVFGLGYVCAIRLFANDYFTTMLPLLRSTYWAFGHLGWLGLVGEAPQLHILAVACFAGLIWAGWRNVSGLVLLFLAAGLAATCGYYLQGTGWYYQQIPALSFFTLGLVLLLAEQAEKRHWLVPVWTSKAALGLSALALALTTHFSGYPFLPEHSFPIDTPDPSFFARLAPGTPVATLTTTVDYAVPPVFKYHLTLAQRYPHLWMLPAILRSESGEPGMPPDRLRRLKQLQHAAMDEDFLRWRPRLVLVERCQDPAVHCQVLEDRHDNLLAWFLRDPRFQQIFSGYRYLRSSGPFDAYVPN